MHARGQVVNFRTSRPVALENVLAVLNRTLPADVKVQQVTEVGAEFHARRSARSRTYEYVIIERATPSPLLGRFALVRPERVQTWSASRRPRQRLLGRHDFRAFQGGGAETKSTERTLLRLDGRRDGDRVTITAQADAFLYQMVRLLVGALLAVSRGEYLPERSGGRVPRRRRARLPAPAAGLRSVSDAGII